MVKASFELEEEGGRRREGGGRLGEGGCACIYLCMY